VEEGWEGTEENLSKKRMKASGQKWKLMRAMKLEIKKPERLEKIAIENNEKDNERKRESESKV
jgi:hypothetical protein